MLMIDPSTLKCVLNLNKFTPVRIVIVFVSFNVELCEGKNTIQQILYGYVDFDLLNIVEQP